MSDIRWQADAEKWFKSEALHIDTYGQEEMEWAFRAGCALGYQTAIDEGKHLCAHFHTNADPIELEETK